MTLWEKVLQYVSRPTVRKVPTPKFEPEWLGQLGPFRQHHPVFSAFKPFAGEVPVEFEVDFIGMRTRNGVQPSITSRDTSTVLTSLPPVDEEYFEWIDLLSSVLDAGESYTMIELGAGYGRWAARAAVAARARGINRIRLGLAEAEPAHILWLKQHLTDNGISTGEAAIYESAISDQTGWMEFYVGMPNDHNDLTAQRWYGQSLSQPYERPHIEAQPSTELYHGREVITYEFGWKAIKVPTVNIRDLLSEYDEIDLLDLDIQGAELRVLTAGAALLDRQVKRLHIGTHSSELETGLRKLLNGRGWIQLRDYAGGQLNCTAFGNVMFADGVQSWLNPRFNLTAR